MSAKISLLKNASLINIAYTTFVVVHYFIFVFLGDIDISKAPCFCACFIIATLSLLHAKYYDLLVMVTCMIQLLRIYF